MTNGIAPAPEGATLARRRGTLRARRAASARARPVLIVTPGGTAERGGMGRIVTAFTRSWQDRGAGPAWRVLDTYGAEGGALRRLRCLAGALARIAAAGLTGRVALLHVHMATRGSVLRKGLVVGLAALLRIPVVLHLHGADFDSFHRGLAAPGRMLVRFVVRRAARLVVLGEYWRRVLVEEVGADPARIDVLPNAVGGPAAAPSRAVAGPCRLLFLGRMEKEKGIPELLDALARPPLAALPWTLTLAGVGEAGPFRAQSAALGLDARVHFLGWVDEAEAHRLLAGSDLLVLPSHREGLSMALLEAMAFGLAVVATPVGANAEAIEDGASGVLVPAGDAAALAAALERLVRNPAARHALQEGARRRWAAAFDIAGYCARLERIYDRALAGDG